MDPQKWLNTCSHQHNLHCISHPQLDEVEREERESEEAANKKSSAGTKKVKKVRTK